MLNVVRHKYRLREPYHSGGVSTFTHISIAGISYTMCTYWFYVLVLQYDEVITVAH